MTCCLWAFEGAIIRVGVEDWPKSTRGALVAAAAAAPAEEAEAERQCDCDAARNQRHQPRLSVIGIGGEEAYTFAFSIRDGQGRWHGWGW